MIIKKYKGTIKKTTKYRILLKLHIVTQMQLSKQWTSRMAEHVINKKTFQGSQ